MSTPATPPSSDQSKYYFISLGCPKNLVDSQVMLGKLDHADYEITQDPAQARVIVINTCSFIQAAREESVDTIFEMAKFKRDGNCQALVVAGCLAQRYSHDLESQVPEIDLIIGTGQYHRIEEFLSRYFDAKKHGQALPERSYIDQPAFIHTESDERTHTGAKYSAFLKVSEGCNRRCSFCIIPSLRGPVRSRSEESLVSEAKKMVQQGVRELNLVAQDLTHYGIDTRYQYRLENLLPELCQIDELEWIRLHYVYPDRLSSEIIDQIARQKKIVNYLDMPIQHTVSRVLKKMNRPLTRERLFSVVEEIRKKIPEMVFRTSIIVGFPGETEEDFRQLCQDLEDLKLDHIGLFQYSPEEGTAAEELPDRVDPQVAEERYQILSGYLAQWSEEAQSQHIGSRIPVLIEGLSEESDLFLKGRASFQAQEIDPSVLINDSQLDEDAQSRLGAGDLVEVEVTEAQAEYLVGSITRVLRPFKHHELLSSPA